MNFTPKTEKEIQESNLIPDKSRCEFEVISAEDKQSAKGNDMIVLSLSIYQNGERKSNIFDYLLEAMAFKLRHFCQVTGLIEKYEDGELTADDCIGKMGGCLIGIQKHKTGAYPDKNVIKDYIDNSGNVTSPDKEDIPF